MNSSIDTREHQEDSMLVSKDHLEVNRNDVEEEHNNKKTVDDVKDVEQQHMDEDDSGNGGEDNDGSEKEPEEDKEQDLFVQQKNKSIVKMAKIAEILIKIEETVSRHKAKAQCLKLDSENPSVYDKDLHRACNTNRYDTGMSSEFLMKHLIELDNCLSYGCGSIKNTRKALVRRIEKIMAQADSLSKQWLKRAQVFEKLKAQLPSCVGGAEEEAGTESDDETNLDSSIEMDVDKISDDSMEEESISTSDKTASPCTSGTDTHTESAAELENDEMSDDAMEEDMTTPNNNEQSPCSSNNHTEDTQNESVSLPHWQPRTQAYHDDSHVVVAAFVPGMSMEQFNIEIDGDDLVVRATKQPTWQDLVNYRHGHAPCFGDLDLKFSLPVDLVHTGGATATYEDGILRVKFIKKQMPQHVWQYHSRQPVPRHKPRGFFNHPLGSFQNLFN